eukprot:TRINITY_DN2669_c0_g1_i22.p2 TRINITY_DN2669_c0_g1~~TRINITY_DN2669_c0_g1_i22.p2  ORF type:complete len:122 (-),score=5.17 TRINITY_DN2669_c0_g1_i22:173-538(-)
MVCGLFPVSSLHFNPPPFLTAALKPSPSHSTHHTSRAVTTHTFQHETPLTTLYHNRFFHTYHSFTADLADSPPPLFFILPSTLSATSNTDTQTGSAISATATSTTGPPLIYDSAPDITSNL